MQLSNSFLIISGIIVVVGLVIFAAGCKNPGESSKAPQTAADTSTSVQKPNPYEDLRNMALHTDLSTLQIEVSSNEEIYGIVMDCDLGDGFMTLVSFKTGDASIYLSTGGGFIGGSHTHKTIENASKAFVDKAQKYISLATAATSAPLPDKGNAAFYLLTAKGIFFTQAKIKDLESGTSDWAPLFEAANGVITEYRLVDQEKK